LPLKLEYLHTHNFSAPSIERKLASTLQYEQPLSDAEVFQICSLGAVTMRAVFDLSHFLQVAGLASTFCEVVAKFLTETTSRLLCTARVLSGGLAQRRLLATSIYSLEAELASGAPINATIARQLSTVDGAELFTNNMKAAFALAIVTPAWTVIPDKPIPFHQMQLLSPAVALYGGNGSLSLIFNVPNTYLDGNVSLTFRSIAVGSVPIVHTYAVPFISLTRTEFRKMIETKYHPTAPLDDGAYRLFVNYTMRKYSQPRNATVNLVIDFDDCANITAECNNGTCVNGANAFSCDCNAGFVGEYCDVNVDDCIGVSCLNGAICQA
jgi:hypothetical protein